MNRAERRLADDAATRSRAVLGDREKRRAAAQLLGQAYVTAYALIADQPRRGASRSPTALIDRKELHGDEVVDLLDSVGLQRPGAST